jgi:hypothetical protein
MAVRQPRYSKAEFAQRGNALYETEILYMLRIGQRQRMSKVRLEIVVIAN